MSFWECSELIVCVCFSKIQIGFTFLIPAHPGSPGKWLLNGCVCVYGVCMVLHASNYMAFILCKIFKLCFTDGDGILYWFSFQFA